jgi:GNAT superfamily N-acetyltransferase
MKIKLSKGYLPGCIGRITQLHATYYYRHSGFGLYFETKVASELAEFMHRYNEHQDGIWMTTVDGVIEGSIAIDGARAADEGAHLRWFIVSDRLRGTGCGNTLLEAALNHCRNRGFPKTYLWTFEGLAAARHLYDKQGFRLTHQQRGVHWGSEVNEQRFELHGSPASNWSLHAEAQARQ